MAAKLFTWGYNAYGQLGSGNTTTTYSPNQVGSLTDWSNVIACGYYDGDGYGFNNGYGFTVGLKTDGTLWSWGLNTYGQLGISNLTSKSSPTQIGASTSWANIGAGARHVAAIKTNGTLWTWGRNTRGQLGDGTTVDKSSPIQIGTATDWATTAGDYFTIATKTTGTLWTWGRNVYGQLGLGNTADISSPTQVGTSTNWSKVTAGTGFAVAIKTTGTLWSWGLNSLGQLGQSSTTNKSSPVQVGSLTDWAEVSAGWEHVVAVKTDGTLWAWGFNTYGQLGDSTQTTRSSPVQVGSLTTWSKVAASDNHTVALKTDGTLWVWGRNDNGQLGDGTVFDRSSPVQIGSLNTWIQVSAGPLFSLGLQNVTSGNTINVPLATLTLTGYAPTVTATANNFIDVPKGTLTLTGYTPTVSVSNNQSVSVPNGTLTLTGYAPTINVSDNKNISVPAASLTLTGYAPTISVGVTTYINVPTATLTLTGYAPTVAVSDNKIIDVPLLGQNLIPYSESFNTAWAHTNITITDNNIIAPDGTLTGTLATFTSATSNNGIVQTWNGTGSSTGNTFTVYVKKGSGASDGNNFYLRNQTTATNIVQGVFNYDTGVITGSGASAVSIGNGWYRIVLKSVSGFSDGDQVRTYIGNDSTPGVGQYFYCWGAQLTRGYGEQPYARTIGTVIDNGFRAYAPTVTATANNFIDVPLATLTLTGYAPTVLNPNNIDVPLATLTLTGYAPTVDVSHNETCFQHNAFQHDAFQCFDVDEIAGGGYPISPDNSRPVRHKPVRNYRDEPFEKGFDLRKRILEKQGIADLPEEEFKEVEDLPEIAFETLPIEVFEMPILDVDYLWELLKGTQSLNGLNIKTPEQIQAEKDEEEILQMILAGII